MADDIEILPVEIHLPGLLKLLGESLYSDPRVALRELTQNAHDSCLRRREEDTTVRDYTPSITVRPDREARQLVIQDNGSGLTRSEVTTFLATVGRGYTSELRARLGEAGREEALELIGYFGLGLLSAFMIARRVDITTVSYQTPDEAWRWVSEGGQSYSLRRAEREGIGTTVRLDLRDDALFLLETDVLASALRAYAEFLPVPIIVGTSAPINGQPAPWAQDGENPGETPGARAIRYGAWVRDRLDAAALSVIPLADARDPSGAVIPLRGVLYVPERSIISIREYGDVAVYVRHMLITDRERDLLPDWARFVTGVVECPVLNPTASRETLRHDETYDAVRASISAQVLAHFERLATEAPLDWSAIVQAHNDLIKGWAVRSPELFLRVADLVTFKTSRGQLTIPEYLRENPGRIFYYDDDDGVTQALTLFEARRLAVIDARWFADVAFLRRYSDVYGTQIQQLMPGAGFIFTPASDPDGAWRAVVEACAAEGLPTRLVAFEPESLPMIILFPPGAERLRRTRRTLEEGRITGPIRRLVRNYMAQQQAGDEQLQGTLHLNTRNPLLRRVRDYGPDRPEFAPLLAILVANARVFAGQGLSAQEAITCFDRINHGLARLTGLDDQPEPSPHMLSAPALVDLGLRADLADRLCGLCPTVDDLLAANLGVLASDLGVSPLLLATIREELSHSAVAASAQQQRPTGAGVIVALEPRTTRRSDGTPDEADEGE